MPQRAAKIFALSCATLAVEGTLTDSVVELVTSLTKISIPADFFSGRWQPSEAFQEFDALVAALHATW